MHFSVVTSKFIDFKFKVPIECNDDNNNSNSNNTNISTAHNVCRNAESEALKARRCK